MEKLTNERLNKRFTNPFKLVNYAIGLAKVRVGRGEGMRSHLVTEVLQTITDNEDSPEEVVEEVAEETEE